ncbi:MAG TPA: hypothetical protein VFH45_02975 [Acidimicrobiales bacterium]|nr:hypothetical protein [Acidimicrobiales bacterium]
MIGRSVRARPDAAGSAEVRATGPIRSGRAAAGVRQAGPLALAGLAANGANVLVTVIVARLLSVRGYGSLNELVSVFLVLSMPGSALLVAVVRRVSAWEASGDRDRVGPWASRIRRTGAVAAAALVLAGWLVRGQVADLLSLPSSSGVPEVLAAGAVWGLLCVDRGLLQSRRSYRRLARNLLVEGGARTLLTLGMVGLGWGVAGAVGGLVGGVGVALVDARLGVGRTGRRRGAVAPEEEALGVPVVAQVAALAAPTDAPVASSHPRLGAEVAVALAALALLAFLQSCDVLVLGHLAPGNVGPYAAISVASKALVFAALVLAGFLLPEAATRWRRGDHALHELGVALAVLLVPAGALLAFSIAAPRLVLSIAFGSKLTAAAPAFAPLAAAMGLLGSTALFTHYLLGVGHRRVVLLLGLAAVASVFVIGSAGGSPAATAWRDLAVQAALAAAAAVMVVSIHSDVYRRPVA